MTVMKWKPAVARGVGGSVAHVVFSKTQPPLADLGPFSVQVSISEGTALNASEAIVVQRFIFCVGATQAPVGVCMEGSLPAPRL